jgi:hypothetical protein
VPPTLEFSYPGKAYLERAYNFKITKNTFPHDNFSVPQVKFSGDFIFSSFGAATHGILLHLDQNEPPGEVLNEPPGFILGIHLKR